MITRLVSRCLAILLANSMEGSLNLLYVPLIFFHFYLSVSAYRLRSCGVLLRRWSIGLSPQPAFSIFSCCVHEHILRTANSSNSCVKVYLLSSTHANGIYTRSGCLPVFNFNFSIYSSTHDFTARLCSCVSSVSFLCYIKESSMTWRY